jgi:hypothetical protein
VECIAQPGLWQLQTLTPVMSGRFERMRVFDLSACACSINAGARRSVTCRAGEEGAVLVNLSRDLFMAFIAAKPRTLQIYLHKARACPAAVLGFYARALLGWRGAAPASVKLGVDALYMGRGAMQPYQSQ